MTDSRTCNYNPHNYRTLQLLCSNYPGLPVDESRELKNYVHYRRPVQRWNTNLLTRKDYNYALDFLDSVDIDLPKGIFLFKTNFTIPN